MTNPSADDPPVITEAGAAAIVRAFAEHKVRHVVVGAFGALCWGAPIEATRDVDTTPADDPENLDALVGALEDLGARLRVRGYPEGVPFSYTREFLEERQVYAMQCQHGLFDLTFLPDGTAGYPDLVVRMSVRLAAATAIPVAHLGDIIRSKGTANRPKDQIVLPDLVRFAQQEGIDPFTVPASGRPVVPPRPLSPEHARRLADYYQVITGAPPAVDPIDPVPLLKLATDPASSAARSRARQVDYDYYAPNPPTPPSGGVKI